SKRHLLAEETEGLESYLDVSSPAGSPSAECPHLGVSDSAVEWEDSGQGAIAPSKADVIATPNAQAVCHDPVDGSYEPDRCDLELADLVEALIEHPVSDDDVCARYTRALERHPVLLAGLPLRGLDAKARPSRLARRIILAGLSGVAGATELI